MGDKSSRTARFEELAKMQGDYTPARLFMVAAREIEIATIESDSMAPQENRWSEIYLAAKGLQTHLEDHGEPPAEDNTNLGIMTLAYNNSATETSVQEAIQKLDLFVSAYDSALRTGELDMRATL